ARTRSAPRRLPAPGPCGRRRRRSKPPSARRSRRCACLPGSWPLLSERTVGVAAADEVLTLRRQRLQGAAERTAGVERVDHLVDEAALGRRLRRAVALPVVVLESGLH